MKRIKPSTLTSLTSPRTATLWGNDYTITPALVSRIDGDGLRLLTVTPTNTRPNYYLVRVDSECDIDEIVVEVLDWIEDEFNPGCECDDATDDSEDCTRHPFPALDLGAGYVWDELALGEDDYDEA